jgi:hypothetical protein
MSLLTRKLVGDRTMKKISRIPLENTRDSLCVRIAEPKADEAQQAGESTVCPKKSGSAALGGMPGFEEGGYPVQLC